MKVSALYRPDIITAGAHEDLAAIACRMDFHEVGALAVFKADTLIGIITERDLVRAMADGVDLATTTVERYMTREVVTTTPETSVAEAAAMMLELGARHLPVSEGGRIVGMVSARDVLVDEAWNELEGATR